MAYEKSVFENLSEKLSPVIRKLSDVALNLLGQQVKMIRISEIDDDINNDGYSDLLGDTTNSYQSQIVNNALIRLPASEIEIFPSKDNSNQSAESISITDFLPIIVSIPFEGNRDDTLVDMDSNDILVAIMEDHKGNKIPLVLQSPKQVSGFFGKYEVNRKYECTLHRGILEDEIQEHINNYIESLGTPAVLSTVPVDDAIGVSISGSLVIDFNTSMDSTTTLSAISINPSISTTSSWDTYSGQLTLTPDTNLASGTLYTVSINTTAESLGGIPFEENYSFNFTTE